MYYDFYVYTDQFLNFEKPFEITEMLIESVDEDMLTGYNFNRYSKEGNDSSPHITVRLDLVNANQTAKVMVRLSTMKNNGIIDGYTHNNPLVDTPFRSMSINHHLAHEVSTKCAFTFYEKKRHNIDSFVELYKDKVVFLTEFLPLWLKYSEYSFEGIDSVSSSPLTCIDELAKECGIIVKQVDKGRITDIFRFNERLIHTFLNCVCVSYGEEATLSSNLAVSFGYAPLDELLRDLTFNQ